MTTRTQSEYRRPRNSRRLLVALVAVAVLAVGAPATPVLGGPASAFATQGSGGGSGP